MDKATITSLNIYQIYTALNLVLKQGGDETGWLTEQGREVTIQLRDIFLELSHPDDEDYLFEIIRGQRIEREQPFLKQGEKEI